MNYLHYLLLLLFRPLHLRHGKQTLPPSSDDMWRRNMNYLHYLFLLLLLRPSTSAMANKPYPHRLMICGVDI